MEEGTSRRGFLQGMIVGAIGAAAGAHSAMAVEDVLSQIVNEENARLRKELEAFDPAGVRKRAKFEMGEYHGRLHLAVPLSGSLVNYQAVHPKSQLVVVAPKQLLSGKIALDVTHGHGPNAAFPVVYTFNGKSGIGTLRPEHRKLDPAQPRRYNIDLDEHSALIAPSEAGRYWLGIFGQAQAGDDLEDAARYVLEGRAWTTKKHDPNSPFALTKVFGDEEAYFALRQNWLPKRQQGKDGEELGLLAATALRIVVDPKIAWDYKKPEEKGVIR
jgi:hypothetical protein